MSPTAPVPEDAAALARHARDRCLAGLLQAAAAGSASAFEEFYDATIAYAQAVARRLLRGDDVDDVLAEVYFQVWRTAAQFDATRGSPVTWLLNAVRSRAIDLRRHQAAFPSLGGEIELDDQAAADSDPQHDAWQAEIGSRLDEALRALKPAERWVLGLAYHADLPHSAIAQATGMPLGTVKSHIARAQAKLRERLEA